MQQFAAVMPTTVLASLFALFISVFSRIAGLAQALFLVIYVLALKKDLKREVLGVYNIPVESAKGWKTVIQDLKRLQKCLVHKIRNII